MWRSLGQCQRWPFPLYECFRLQQRWHLVVFRPKMLKIDDNFLNKLASLSYRHVESKTAAECSWVHQQHWMFSDGERHFSQNRQNDVGDGDVWCKFRESLTHQADQQQENQEWKFLEANERRSQHLWHSWSFAAFSQSKTTAQQEYEWPKGECQCFVMI